MRAAALLVVWLTGCAAAPVDTTPPVPNPETQTKVVYVPVKIKSDDLAQCIRTKRIEVQEKSAWQEYAGKLEQLLGISDD